MTGFMTTASPLFWSVLNLGLFTVPGWFCWMLYCFSTAGGAAPFAGIMYPEHQTLRLLREISRA